MNFVHAELHSVISDLPHAVTAFSSRLAYLVAAHLLFNPGIPLLSSIQAWALLFLHISRSPSCEWTPDDLLVIESFVVSFEKATDEYFYVTSRF